MLDRDELVLVASQVDYTYDELDTNALNFVVEGGYFSIQTCVYLEDDPQLNEPFFELHSEAGGQNGGLCQVTLSPSRVVFGFGDGGFLATYTRVVVVLPEEVTTELVDFVVNHLFLGEVVSYGPDFDPAKVCAPTARREPL